MAITDRDQGDGDSKEKKEVSLAGLGVAATLVVGVLAAVGVAGDLLPRMVRNRSPHILWVMSGTILVVWLAFLGSIFEKGGRFLTGLVASAITASLIVTAAIGISSLSEREQPEVSLSIKHPDKDLPLVVEAKAAGSSLRSKERLLLRVIALNGTSQDYLKSLCQQPTFDDPKNVRLLSWTETGPNAKGEAKTDATIDAPAGFSHYCAYVVLSQGKGRRTRTVESNWAIARTPE